MGYFTTPFGDGVSTTRVTDVHNHFGQRDTGGAAGVVRTEGFGEQLTIDINGRDYNDGIDTLVATKLPAGSVVKAAYWETTEAFVATGTTPALLVGTSGSEAANGVSISEAQLEAVGVYNVTAALVGTWDAEAPLAAVTTVGVALGGTTPAITDAGAGRLIVVYERAGS